MDTIPGEVSLSNFLRAMLRRKGFFVSLFCVLVTFLLVFIFFIYAPKKHTFRIQAQIKVGTTLRVQSDSNQGAVTGLLDSPEITMERLKDRASEPLRIALSQRYTIVQTKPGLFTLVYVSPTPDLGVQYLSTLLESIESDHRDVQARLAQNFERHLLTLKNHQEEVDRLVAKWTPKTNSLGDLIADSKQTKLTIDRLESYRNEFPLRPSVVVEKPFYSDPSNDLRSPVVPLLGFVTSLVVSVFVCLLVNAILLRRDVRANHQGLTSR